MALVLKSLSATFTKYRDNILQYPVSRGLLGAYFFGSAQPSALTNYAGGADLSVVGSPTVNTYSAVVSKTAGYNTGFAEPTELTLVVVTQKLSTVGQSLAFTNANSSGTDADIGSSLGQFNNTLQALVGMTTGTVMAVTPSTAAMSTGTPFFSACRYKTSGTLVSASIGVAGSLTHTNSTMTPGTRSVDSEVTMKIGVHTFAGFANTTEIYAAALHNVSLTDDEVNTVYQALRSRYAALGIATL